MSHIFVIIGFAGQEDETFIARDIMLPTNAILPLIGFMALLLAAAMCGLAASGHFPKNHRAPSLRETAGTWILFGSLAIAILSLAIGIMFVWALVHWSALVIGGGGAILATPFALRPFPDQFVNGRGALVTFSGACAITSIILLFVAGG
jgi:hypothetical protein